MLDAREVDRDPIAGTDAVDGVVERLQRADARGATARLDDDLVVDVELAAGERAGDDRAGAPCREDAVDPEARPLPIGCCGSGVDETVERGAQLVDADAERVRRRRRPRRLRGTCPRRDRRRRASRARGGRRRRGRPGSARSRRAAGRAARGCAGAPRVCGFHPSVAATTKRHASTDPTPASMFLMKRT